MSVKNPHVPRCNSTCSSMRALEFVNWGGTCGMTTLTNAATATSAIRLTATLTEVSFFQTQ